MTPIPGKAHIKMLHGQWIAVFVGRWDSVFKLQDASNWCRMMNKRRAVDAWMRK